MADNDARILITGLGVVSPLGNTLREYWDGLLYRSIEPRPTARIAASAVSNRLFYSVGDGADTAHDGRANAFALEAAREALADAGLPERQAGRSTIGLAVGSALGSHDVLERARAEGREPSADEHLFYDMSARLAAALGLDGPNLTISTACSAGLYGIGLARDAILSGTAAVMLAGGSDAESRIALGCFNRVQALDGERCRPFNAERRGTVGGEGAAFAVLESQSHWASRGGPRAYGILLGDGWSCDGTHITAPDPEGTQVEIALRRALSAAGIEPDAVDCIVAHGTGTRLNDEVESKLIRRVFGEPPQGPWVVAPKSKLGHSGGAAGAFGFLTSALIVHHQVVPPAANLEPVDPACNMRFNLGAPRPCRLRTVMANSYGFGGNNISVLVGHAGHE
jgi:3-oxoacyl-(acyl-carrier-protein) synthase